MKDRFAGNKLNKVYDLVCIDERLLKAFKGIYAEVLKKLATTLMSGRSPVGMSLSVRIFEPESLISRMIFTSLLVFLDFKKDSFLKCKNCRTRIILAFRE